MHLATDRPTFSLLSDATQHLPSVDRLDASLTINSTTVTPTFVYYGGAATSTTWAGEVGDTITLSAAGSVAFDQGSPLLGTNDDSVAFDGTNYYQPASFSFGDIATEDFVIEAVVKITTVNDFNAILSKRNTSNDGWYLSVNSGNSTLRFAGDETASANAFGINATANSISANAWHHILVFADRSGNLSFFVNGTSQGSGAISAVGTMSTNNAYLTVGALRTDGNSPFDGSIAYIAMWKQASWLDTSNQSSLAQERFLKLTGFWPQRAIGTKAPTTKTRASTAYLDKVESDVRYLYQVGDHWMRYCNRVDSNSDEISGYLPETSVQNKCLQSEDVATTWTKLDAGDSFDLNAIAAPNKETTADGLIADSTDGDHGITQDITLTAVHWVVSVFAKAGNKDWLYISDDTVANATCYFDLATPAVGTEGAGVVESYIEDWGNGWVRCGVCFAGTAAAHTIKIQTADADGDKSIQGNGSTVNTYLWGMQAEITGFIRNFSSYIPTTTAAITRSADVLIYKGDDGNIVNNQAGTIVCDILMPTFNTAAFSAMVNLNDGGSSNDQIGFSVANNDFADNNTRTSGGNNGDSTCTTKLTDNVIHNVRTTWKVNDVRAYTDGVQEGASDTSADIPDDLDRICPGHSNSNTGQLRGVISNLKIYPFPTTK